MASSIIRFTSFLGAGITVALMFLGFVSGMAFILSAIFITQFRPHRLAPGFVFFTCLCFSLPLRISVSVSDDNTLEFKEESYSCLTRGAPKQLDTVNVKAETFLVFHLSRSASRQVSKNGPVNRLSVPHESVPFTFFFFYTV